MKTLALLLMWVTLWMDFCLVLGVVFTHEHGQAKIAAVISLGDYSIDSTHGGASMILFISVWTAALAALGLRALGQAHQEKQGSKS